jgi:hypothetical protein
MPLWIIHIWNFDDTKLGCKACVVCRKWYIILNHVTMDKTVNVSKTVGWVRWNLILEPCILQSDVDKMWLWPWKALCGLLPRRSDCRLPSPEWEVLRAALVFPQLGVLFISALPAVCASEALLYLHHLANIITLCPYLCGATQWFSGFK